MSDLSVSLISLEIDNKNSNFYFIGFQSKMNRIYIYLYMCTHWSMFSGESMKWEHSYVCLNFEMR